MEEFHYVPVIMVDQNSLYKMFKDEKWFAIKITDAGTKFCEHSFFFKILKCYPNAGTKFCEHFIFLQDFFEIMLR